MSKSTQLNDPQRIAPQKPFLGDDRTLIRATFILGAVLVVWKLYIATISHVIWEEGHFVMSGEYLDLGYPDIPAGFPWLARLVTMIFGWHVMPLRLVALAIATAIPFGVYFMATPVTSHRNALWAATIALLLPPSSLNGTVFYPEGALQLLLVLMLGALIRALQTDRLKWWVWTGVFSALGLLVHFRFLVPGLAVVMFMLLNAQGRDLWKRQGLWIAAGIALLGLLPSLAYNAMNDWPAIQFHVINRPRFDPNPKHILSFVETQIGIVTPVFFIALIAASRISLIKDRQRPDTLLGYQAVIIFLFYCLQALVNKKIMPHWPFLSYLPLLPYMPDVLEAFVDGARSLTMRYVRMGLIALGPIMALGIGITASIYQYDYVHSAELPYKTREFNVLKNENWSLLEPDLLAADALAKKRFGPDVAWATSGHIAAVHIEFPAEPGIKGRRLYTLGDPYDEMSRFIVARRKWGLDMSSLIKNKAGKGVVLAIQEPAYVYHEPEQVNMYTAMCQNFEQIEPYKIDALPPYRTAIDIYTARVRTTPSSDISGLNCPIFPKLYIAHPQRGDFLSHHDSGQYFGLAADPIGLKGVDVLIDGKFVVHTSYGKDDINFHAPALLKYDPHWPNLQFTFVFPEGSLVPGEHRLSVRGTRTDGTTVDSDPRTLYVH